MTPSSLQIDISTLLNDPAGFFQQLFKSFSTIELAGYAFLFVLIIWGISLTKKYVSMRDPAGSFDPLREAEQAARSQDPLRAGELFEQAGQLDQAIKAYKEAKAYQQIGRIYELKKQWGNAAQFYKLAGDEEKSAIMYHRAGEYLNAAEGYLACKKISLAAEMLEKGKKYKEAAVQYERFGNLPKAASLYERSKELEKAAQLYETHFQKLKISSSEPSQEKLKQVQQMAYQSGQLYLKVSKFQKAIDVFSAGGFLAQAADAAIQGGELEKAAQLYLSANNYEKASELFERVGDHKQAQKVLGRKHREEKNLLEAAVAFATGESWIEAADMYQQAGEKEKAGEMFMNGGDYHRAADYFVEAGRYESAAACYEKGGRLQEASELYTKIELFDKAAQIEESIGNFYRAALLLKQQGKLQQSISYLQKVDSQSEQYYDASILLSQLLIEGGMMEAARERIQKIVSQEPISSRNLEFYYQLALVYEKSKEFEEAQKLYEKILAEDFNYKDAKSRSDLLKKALTEVKKVLEASRVEKPAKPAAPSLAAGKSRYKILKKIGQGGMGIVYQAEDDVLGRIVAYKVLSAAIKENQTILQNFLQEARIAAALNHPNVVTLYDTGRNGDEIFITMEFVDGISLKEYLEKNGPSMTELIKIMKEICRGVEYAHTKNVVHRDLKPANVMLTRDLTVKIMDFGLAKIVTESMADKTSVKGTPLYMAPEQILGQKVDHQSDIYALGCTFYRMVAGRPPFIQGDIYYHHLHTVPKTPRSLNPKLPEDLDRIILKCIEKEKSKRYRTVGDILQDLLLLP